MEGGRKKSFVTDLFGEKDKPSSPSGVFGSIFAPPSQVFGKEIKKNGYGNPAWHTETKGVSGDEGQSKDVGSYYQQEEKVQPFHYSSSIHYGGQDVIYNGPPQACKPPAFTTFKKDGSEDDSGGASRGDWWQGSLYY